MTRTAGEVAAAKAALRVSMLAARDALTPQLRMRASLRIQQQILAHPAFGRARVVMAYCSFSSELDTSVLIAAVYAHGKTLVLPRIDRQRQALAPFVVRDIASELQANAWGIREPRPEACRCANLSEVDFIVVPGVAFDTGGGRLGYGKGYYDRLLRTRSQASPTPFTVAGAFEAQITDRVPMEAHDVAVMCIATEERMIDCTGQRKYG